MTTADLALATELRRAVTGTVYSPSDDGFDAVSRPWSLLVQQPVRAVVEVADAADVAAATRCARHLGLAVAAQPVGHGATEALADTILLRTAALDKIAVDTAERRVRVGAGVRWAPVFELLNQARLVPLAGSSDSPSVVGYTLGGGLAWLSRRHGFAANSVQRFEVVTADAEIAVVTADSDPDLFWALRGGGGDFALVTAMDFGVYPADRLWGGRLLWPMERAADVIAAYRSVTATAPDDLTLWLNLAWLPDLEVIPEPLRGQRLVSVDAMCLTGEPAEVAPLRAVGGTIMDSMRPLPVGEYATVSADPSDPSPSIAQGMLLGDFDDTVEQALLTRTEPGTTPPFVAMQIRHLGGALARSVPGGGAVGAVAEPYLCSAVSVAPMPPAQAAAHEGFAALRREFGAASSPRTTFNLLGHDDPIDPAFEPSTLDRLRTLKRDRDPDGIFRSNHPILSTKD